MDPFAVHRSEEGEMVGGDVDRSSPRTFDPSVGEARQEPPQAVLSSRCRRIVRRERPSTRPRNPIGPEPLPISTRPSGVVRK